MKPRLFTLSLVIAAATFLACGKKSSSPPTAPPATPQCAVSTATLGFGSVAVGASADLPLTLTNSGGGTLAGTVTESCPGFAIVGGAGYSLTAGQSNAFTVRFSPAAAGAFACTLSVAGCQVICTGTGVAQTIPCVLSTTTLDFGDVTLGQNVDLTFTLTNQGTSTLSGWVDSSCPDFNPQGDVLYNLAPGEVATILVRFTPTQTGLQSCTISTGAPGCPSVSVSGTGVTLNPACNLSTNGLLFPQVAVGDRADATFELTNTGTTTLAGTVTESCPEFSIPGQASYSLAPGASQSFIVRFSPSAVGDQTCRVGVGPGCPPVSCWGSGVIGCTFTPDTIQFGYVRGGDIRCGSLTLKNNTATLQQGQLFAQRFGGSGGNVGSILLDGVSVIGTTGLDYALNAGQSRTFTICWTTQFALLPCDSLIAQWKIVSTDPGCMSWSPIIRGIITRGCDCSLSATALDFGSVVVGETSFEQTIHVTNTSGIGGLRGQVRVLSGDFEATPEYVCPPPGGGGCTSCGHVGGTAQRPMPVHVTFRPGRLGSQTGKILIENLVGCLGPGASTICDTLTVTGAGVTAVPR